MLKALDSGLSIAGPGGVVAIQEDADEGRAVVVQWTEAPPTVVTHASRRPAVSAAWLDREHVLVGVWSEDGGLVELVNVQPARILQRVIVEADGRDQCWGGCDQSSFPHVHDPANRRGPWK